MQTYRNPTPTVDVLIEMGDGIVFIERRNPPLGWALPGGFVDEGEHVAQAAIREAKEETGLDIHLVEQFFCYSDPSRDPRQHTLSVVFIAQASGQLMAGDDASGARIFPLSQLPTSLVFDHQTIVNDYLCYRSTGRRPPAQR